MSMNFLSAVGGFEAGVAVGFLTAVLLLWVFLTVVCSDDGAQQE
jgi:hypothetical protein